MRFFKRAFPILLVFLCISAAQARFGNWFLASQRLSTALDSSDKKLSLRFTCQEDINLTAASVYCLESLQAPAYKLSLREDQGGKPSETALTYGSYVPLTHSWSTVPLGAVPLLKGKVYHLVLEQDLNRGGDHRVGAIGPQQYASFLSTDVLNKIHPNDGSPDPQANVLFFQKDKWKTLNQEPVYALYGSGFKSQGNPYDDPFTRPIHGNGTPDDRKDDTLQGQVLHFHCAYSAEKLVFRVRKQGNPKSPLNYQILKHNFHEHRTSLEYSGLAVNAANVSSDFKWVTIGFEDKSLSVFSPECWYLTLQTDAGRGSKNDPGCEDCYVISGIRNSGGLADAAKLTFDGGPHLSRATSSLDGGVPSHWLDDFEGDLNLGTLGPDCHTSGPIQLRAVPTPLLLESHGGFNP